MERQGTHGGSTPLEGRILDDTDALPFFLREDTTYSPAGESQNAASAPLAGGRVEAETSAWFSAPQSPAAPSGNGYPIPGEGTGASGVTAQNYAPPMFGQSPGDVSRPAGRPPFTPPPVVRRPPVHIIRPPQPGSAPTRVQPPYQPPAGTETVGSMFAARASELPAEDSPRRSHKRAGVALAVVAVAAMGVAGVRVVGDHTRAEPKASVVPIPSATHTRTNELLAPEPAPTTIPPTRPKPLQPLPSPTTVPAQPTPTKAPTVTTKPSAKSSPKPSASPPPVVVAPTPQPTTPTETPATTEAVPTTAAPSPRETTPTPTATESSPALPDSQLVAELKGAVNTVRKADLLRQVPTLKDYLDPAKLGQNAHLGGLNANEVRAFRDHAGLVYQDERFNFLGDSQSLTDESLQGKDGQEAAQTIIYNHDNVLQKTVAPYQANGSDTLEAVDVASVTTVERSNEKQLVQQVADGTLDGSRLVGSNAAILGVELATLGDGSVVQVVAVNATYGQGQAAASEVGWYMLVQQLDGRWLSTALAHVRLASQGQPATQTPTFTSSAPGPTSQAGNTTENNGIGGFFGKLHDWLGGQGHSG